MIAVRVSPAARTDLRDIWLYTAEKWSPDQADRYVSMIEERFRQLAALEIKGRSAIEFRSGYFRIAVGSHFIFYKTAEDGAIDVVRVLHQRMNHVSHLKNS